jgi:OmpA-OmpF porin, OOP family
MTGCDGFLDFVLGENFEFHCPQPEHSAVAIAVGARANSPAPQLPEEVRRLVTEAMDGCGKITVIRVDGRPSIVGDTRFHSTARSPQAFDLDQTAFLRRVLELVNNAGAQAPEADVLSALSLAAHEAGPGGIVVLIDSGVQTTDPLDFRRDNLPLREPEAIADALRQEGLLPDLSERTVILASLGYTAEPQDALDNRNQAFVTQLWREIVLASGAIDPIVLAASNTDEAVTHDPSVGVVDFPIASINAVCNSLSVLPDTGEVGFLPDRAEFRDPDAARVVLREFAEFLTTASDATVEIEGFVAHYGTGDLSQRRADRVKAELVALGVQSHISATGQGWGPYPQPSAGPDPRYDQLNRRVTIAVTC